MVQQELGIGVPQVSSDHFSNGVLVQHAALL